MENVIILFAFNLPLSPCARREDEGSIVFLRECPAAKGEKRRTGEMRLKDKVASVTRAGRGIGEGIALRLAEEGPRWW